MKRPQRPRVERGSFSLEFCDEELAAESDGRGAIASSRVNRHRSEITRALRESMASSNTHNKERTSSSSLSLD
jgi:hypothetical protein